MARTPPINANTDAGGHEGDAKNFDNNAPGPSGSAAAPTTGFDNATNDPAPMRPGDGEVRPEDQKLKEGRDRFEKAYAKNHGWEEGKELTPEQRAEIKAHPYWQDPSHWAASVDGTATDANSPQK